MSTLTLILTMGMVVGDVPDQVQGEMQEIRLDMRGRWEGTFLNAGGIKWNTVIEDGKKRCYDKGKLIALSAWKVVDQGEGKLLLDINPNKGCWGIYKLEGDRLTICFADMPNPRPKEFRVAKRQAMYILRRVK